MTPAPAKITCGISGARWQLAACDEVALRQLHAATGEPLLLLRCLLNRGILNAAEIARFLAPDFPTARPFSGGGFILASAFWVHQPERYT